MPILNKMKITLVCFISTYQTRLFNEDFNIRNGTQPFNYFKECTSHYFIWKALQNLKILPKI